jgi:hypothetical protein
MARRNASSHRIAAQHHHTLTEKSQQHNGLTLHITDLKISTTMAAVAQQYREEAIDEQQGESMEVRWLRGLFFAVSDQLLVVMVDELPVSAQ